MPTERLYYNDCYQAVFDARAVKISDDGRRVYLDRTAFYPTSGGQPHDLGRLNGIEVVDVVDEGEEIAHVLSTPFPDPHDGPAQGEIDWKRRYGHMQQHTGQHLLSACFAEVIGATTLSFHMGAEVSTIELDTKQLSEPDIERVEERVHELAWAALPIRIFYQDAVESIGLRKPSDRTGALRIIEIEAPCVRDAFRSACGGTHVRSTAELAPIQVRSSEKVRGNVRIEFVCGSRALRHAKADYQLLSSAAQELGCPMMAAPAAITKLREQVAGKEKEAKRLAAEIAAVDADRLYAATQTDRSGVRFAEQRCPSLDDRIRQMVISFTARPGAAVAVYTDDRTLLFAVSPDSGLNAGQVLRALFARLGGKGGGSPSTAQGVLPETASSDLVFRELQAACESAAHSATGK